MKKTMFFLMIWLISLASSCHKDIQSDSRNPTPVALELRITDLNRNKINVIPEGDNFTLSFLLTNNSDSVWWFRRQHFKSIDLFRVFDNKNNSLGRSFEFEMCDPGGAEIGDIGIRPHESYEIGVYWLHPQGQQYALFCNPIDAPALQKGSYYTAFKGSLQFQKDRKVYVTDSIDFQYDFKVK